MNGMILGAYEQAWRRSGSPSSTEEYPGSFAEATSNDRSSARWNTGALIGFAAMAIALFFAGASYA